MAKTARSSLKPTEAIMRLEALNQALRVSQVQNGDQVLETAEKFLKFLKGDA